MKLKSPKETKEEYVKARCHQVDKNAMQVKANLYTDGNLSEWVLYASMNFVPGKEDFEKPKKKKGRK